MTAEHEGHAGHEGRAGHERHAGKEGPAGREGHAGYEGRAGQEGRAGYGGRAGQEGPAGYEGRAGHEGCAGHEGRAGLDALMAAITDEPLPDEARADAAFLAEHRSATADVALLREQLEIIGRALADPAPAPAPEPVPVPGPLRPSRTRQRAFRFAFGTLAVTAAAAVVTGMGWLVAHNGGSDLDSGGSTADSKAVTPASGDAAFGSPRYLACARLVVEGEVTTVELLPGTGQQRIHLRVTRSYVPKKSDEEVTFLLEEDAVRKGDHVLVGIPRHTAVPDVWAVGERAIAPQRAGIIATLADTRKQTCE